MFSLVFSGGLKAWVVLCKIVGFLVACIIHPTLCVTTLILLLIAEVLYRFKYFVLLCYLNVVLT